MATSARPSGVSAKKELNIYSDAKQEEQGLTERYRTRHFARELTFLIPRRSIGTLSNRRYNKRFSAQILHLKHFIRVLNGLPQPKRIHQFLLPLRSNLGGFRVQDIRATCAAIVV